MKTVPTTLDVIVAANIRRLRRQQGHMTREELAGELSSILGRPISKWRITDLEGGRTRDQVPRPVTWTELVALAEALDTTIYSLVLPPTEDESGPPFGDEEDGLIPIDVFVVPFGWDLEQTDRSTGSPRRMGFGLNREMLLHSVFRIPEDVVALIRNGQMYEEKISAQRSLELRLETIEKLLRESPGLRRAGQGDENGGQA